MDGVLHFEDSGAQEILIGTDGAGFGEYELAAAAVTTVAPRQIDFGASLGTAGARGARRDGQFVIAFSTKEWLVGAGLALGAAADAARREEEVGGSGGGLAKQVEAQ
jgi:hypothetical protein